MDNKPTLLIIDDEPSITKALKRLFMNEDYNVLATTDTNEAVSILKNEKVDLIICDQNMPGILGLDILRYSKEVSPDSIRILLTGDSDLHVAVTAINEGHIYYYFAKPWKNEEVRAVVRKALEQKRERDEKDALFEIMKRSQNDVLELSNKLSSLLGLSEDRAPDESRAGGRENKETAQADHSKRTAGQGIGKIPVWWDDQLLLIDVADILYLNAGDGSVNVITKSGVNQSRESLGAWEEKLSGGRFFRCHRSYIINIDHIEKITPWFNGTYNIKLKDRTENIPVSRNNIKELKRIISF